jgi:hypothetical protein
MLILTHESHTQRLIIQDQLISDKGTQAAYYRHIKKYEDWWEKDQARRKTEELEKGLNWEHISSHPINATKVSLFLQYQTTRAKVSLFIN